MAELLPHAPCSRTRRTVMASALALAACGRNGAAHGQAASTPEIPPNRPTPALRDLAQFPVGVCVLSERIDDPSVAPLIARQFSQVTPEWEMQMGAVLNDDGTFRWAGADRVVAFAEANRQRVHAHCLVWHAMDPIAFKRIDGSGHGFASAYRNYILAVAGRYRGRVVSWDVVNEPVTDDGNDLRQCLWSRNLGQEDYILRAFEHAREADPQALLLMNEFNLEALPNKRATFLRLVERLLKRGAPIGGIGNQSHLEIDLRSGAVTTAMRDLASLGLPIHVSELDVSTAQRRFDTRSMPERLRLQARLVAETADAFLALPPGQRHAFTIWGARDKDSWLTRKPFGKSPDDRPLLFDDAGRPKPSFWALADRLKA